MKKTSINSTNRKGANSKRMLAALITTTVFFGQSVSPMAATLNGAKINGKDLKAITSSTVDKSVKMYEFKINPPKDGNYTDPATGFKVTVKFTYEKGGAKKVTWSSNYPVYSVLVKGGKKGGNLYQHEGGSLGSTEINTPDNEGIGHGHATFYYSLPTSSTVVTPVVTEPVVTPVVTEPVVTPVVTEPVVTPVVTEPVVTEPIVMEPVVTEPIVREPIVEESVLADLSVTDMVQTSGFVTGGDFVTIDGTGFQEGLAVKLGGVNATVVNYYSDTQIRIAIPQASAEGTVDLEITRADGQVASLASAYTYLSVAAAAPTITSLAQTSGLISGGDYVVVNGTGFQKGLTVKLGGVDTTVVNYYSDTQIRIIIPQGSVEGAMDFAVTNPDGQTISLVSAYTYLQLPAAEAPAITSLSQTTGLITGGDYVVVKGTGFQQGLTVKLGGIDAKIVNFYGSTSFRIQIPSGISSGAADFAVTNPDGQSVSLSGAYTYTLPVVTLTSLSTTSGEYAGGSYVNIYGTSFDKNSVVTVNNVPVSTYYYSQNQIKILAMPSGDALGLPSTGGVIPITVTDSYGNSVSANFTYKAKPVTLVPVITKMTGAGGTAATGSIAGGTYVYFYGTGFTNTMKVRLYDPSNTLVKEESITNFYTEGTVRYLTSKVTTAGTYTVKLVNIDGVESNGMTYIYK